MRLQVSGLIPPKKDGANSMWRKPAAIAQLKELRTAAAQAMDGREAWDEPVAMTLRLYVPAPQGEPTLWIRRQRGDLDNFIAGVCDGLGAAHPWSFDGDTWADLPPETHPGRAIVFTDDSWIRRIEAELLDSEGGEIVYEVEVTPLSQM
jgi:Holliday junction resolvase RusA-like endonuclease